MKLKSLSIIFPFFNEEKRLRTSFIKLKKNIKNLERIDIEIILVNDGSTDNSDKITKHFISNLNNKQKKRVRYISYTKNMGKGYALKRGVLKSKKEWILTCDIDFSAEPKSVLSWEKNNYIKSNNFCFFASRRKFTKNVKYKIYRKILGDLFVAVRNFLLNIDVQDTQCGFKLYPKKIAKKIFKKISEYGYIHDIEITILLKKKSIKIVELPIKWKHISGSRLNVAIDGAIMILKLFILRLKY